jgi:hypothetical protein
MAPSGTCQLPAMLSSVTHARHFVIRYLGGLTPLLRSRAELVVHELFLETLRYVPPQVMLDLTVTIAGAAVRIAVTGQRATDLHFGCDANTGDGLRLMELLARDWGRQHLRGNVTAWALISDARRPRHRQRWSALWLRGLCRSRDSAIPEAYPAHGS